MTLHVIVGKGPIGSTTAQQLLEDGAQVRVLSRSGAPAPDDLRSLADADHVAVDASDAEALSRACAGADVVYNCVNPAYHRWATDWPPVADALLTAAETHDAVLVTAANLYVYGPVRGTMTERTPLRSTDTKGRVRAAMWEQALARHEAGRVRATEVRASDYLGPRALVTSHVGERLLAPVLAQKTVRPVGDVDQQHSWTYLPDLARALVAAGATEAAWGSPWHAPSPPPRTYREVAESVARAAGVASPRISPLPMWAVGAVGVVNPMMREIHRIGYQFTEPFVMGSTESEQVLGVAPTDWDEIVSATLAWWRSSGR
jgi:nucleoside-diphosphate-sugar epimerase